MTTADRQAELQYRIQERLGILCGSAKPTSEQLRIAHNEAEDAVARIELEEFRTNQP